VLPPVGGRNAATPCALQVGGPVMGLRKGGHGPDPKAGATVAAADRLSEQVAGVTGCRIWVSSSVSVPGGSVVRLAGTSAFVAEAASDSPDSQADQDQ